MCVSVVVDSLFIVAPIVCVFVCVCVCVGGGLDLCFVMYSSCAIISRRKSELVALILIVFLMSCYY